jgi:choice-of-anchor C domain-containing protein
MRLSILSLTLAGLLCSSATFAATFQNGSFESFDANAANVYCGGGIDFCGQYNAGNNGITAWTIGGSSVDVVGPNLWIASDGTRSIDLDGVAEGTLSQIFDTVAGTSYKVTFDLGGNFYGGPTVKTGTVSAAGQSQSLSFDDAASTPANMGWAQQTFVFVATDASTELSFASTLGGDAGLALDNVSVMAVPGPST